MAAVAGLAGGVPVTHITTAAAVTLSSGCSTAPFVGGVGSPSIASASEFNAPFFAAETMTVTFANPKGGATTGTLIAGQGTSWTGLTNQTTSIPGSLSFTFPSSGNYSIKGSVNAGTSVITFACKAGDTDLALTNVPAAITTNATGPTGAVVAYPPPTVVDEDTPLPPVACDHGSGSTFPIGTTTVTCTATDGDDTPATVSASFTVTVNDTDLALTNVPAGITTAATSAAGAVVTYASPSVVDEDSPLPPVVCDHASGSTFAVGTTTVTCTATDPDDTAASVSASFTVTVGDTDLVITTPPDVTNDAIGPSGANVSYAAPAATDEDGAVAVACDHASGSTFPIGASTVTCTATDPDDSPSTVSASFTVTVNDTDLALASVPANITASTSNPAGTAVAYTAPTASDEDGPVPVVCTPASGFTFPKGTTTVTCTATDTDDTPSTVSASFTVTVTVTDTDLALGTVPTSITASTSNPAGTAVTYTAPTASDEDGPVPVVCTPASGSTFPIGTTTVTCTATDTDDTPSTVSTSFTVTVNDPPPAPSGTASLDQLEAAVKAANLGHGVVEKVERADRALHAGNVRAACSALDGLVDELSGRLHQPKLKARVAPLIVNAQQIESALGCKKDHHSDGSGTGGHRGFESLFAFAAMGELARRRQRNRA